jgi:5-methylcytosine-specific restriction endonuclease McrA
MAGKYLGNRNRWRELDVLLKKQNSCCPYTGIELVMCENASLDHKFPASKGGSNEISNLQWVYLPINSMKLDHTEDEFLELVSKVAIHRLILK